MQKIVLSGLLLVMISSIVFSQTSDCDYLVKYAPTGWEGNKSVAFQLDEEGNVLSKDENVTVKGIMTSYNCSINFTISKGNSKKNIILRYEDIYSAENAGGSAISLDSDYVVRFKNISFYGYPLLSVYSYSQGDSLIGLLKNDEGFIMLEFDPSTLIVTHYYLTTGWYK